MLPFSCQSKDALEEGIEDKSLEAGSPNTVRPQEPWKQRGLVFAEAPRTFPINLDCQD